ncbi:MAG: cation:proton antiporter [Phycisphaeraceae bacterium]
MNLLAAGAELSPEDITRFLLAIALLLGLAKFLGEVARWLRQPSVLGEILAGALLGPTLLGGMLPGFYEWMFPVSGNAFVGLEMLITLAVVLLLLVAGLEVDLSTVWRQGRAALLVSVTGMVIPFGLGFVLAWLLPNLLGLAAGAERLPFALFVGIALSITALPVIAKILIDLNMAKSDTGAIIMSSAMVNDLIGWIGFALVLSMIGSAEGGEAGGMPGGTLTTLSLTLLFLAALLTIGRLATDRLLPVVQAHASWPGGVLVFVFVTAIVCAAFTEWIGIHAIFGAFIAGVAVGDSRHLRERTRDTIHQFVTNIFAPLFFASIGLRVNFVADFSFVMVLVVLLVACIGKIGGCYLGARLGGLGNRESLAIGGGMVARGAMEIILAQLAFAAGLIGVELFVAIVIMALVTSMMAGPIMKNVLRLEQKRRLKDFLADRQILTQPRAHSLEGCIRELAQQAGEITSQPAEPIHEAVMEREGLMHTGLPGGLAVPHARLETLSRPLVIIGRYRHGIDFDAPDGRLAQIVCLLLTPIDQPNTQIELLDLVVRTFQKEEVQSRVMQVETATELLAVLNQLAGAPEPDSHAVAT